MFKSAALRLLDRLAKNAIGQSSRTDAWSKLSGMIEETSEARAAWMADVLVTAVNGEYADKLGTSISISFRILRLHAGWDSLLISCRP